MKKNAPTLVRILCSLVLIPVVALAQSSSSSSAACLDRLPPHINQEAKLLYGKLLSTYSELTYFSVAKQAGEDWEDVSKRLDSKVAPLKTLNFSTGCYSNTDCKHLEFQSFISISGERFESFNFVSFSSLYDIYKSPYSNLTLVKAIYKKYVELDNLIRTTAETEDGILLPNRTMSYPAYTETQSLCLNYVCVKGRVSLFSAVGSTSKQFNYSDGFSNLTMNIPATYNTPIVKIPY